MTNVTDILEVGEKCFEDTTLTVPIVGIDCVDCVDRTDRCGSGHCVHRIVSAMRTQGLG
jgi:hypothetical protein